MHNPNLGVPLGTATVLQGNAHHIPLADETVDLIVTSPPYWGDCAPTKTAATITTIESEPNPASRSTSTHSSPSAVNANEFSNPPGLSVNRPGVSGDFGLPRVSWSRDLGFSCHGDCLTALELDG